MRRAILIALGSAGLAAQAMGQHTVNVPQEEKDKAQRQVAKQQEKKAQHTSVIEFQGIHAFSEKELRSLLKEPIATINDFGLTSARADDAAFFLELIYRKHGYAKVSVHYVIESGDRLRLEVNEGPLTTLGTVVFRGNANEPADKLFEFAVGPTRERYSKMQKKLPFVAADIEEGADLVHRLYVAEGFLDSAVDKPHYTYTMTLIRSMWSFRFAKAVNTFLVMSLYRQSDLRLRNIAGTDPRPFRTALHRRACRRYSAASPGLLQGAGYYDIKAEVTADPTGHCDRPSYRAGEIADLHRRLA